VDQSTVRTPIKQSGLWWLHERLLWHLHITVSDSMNTYIMYEFRYKVIHCVRMKSTSY